LRLAAAVAPALPEGVSEVQASPSAHFALLVAPDAKVVYVNPVVLALTEDATDRAWATSWADPSGRERTCWRGDLPCLADALTLRTVERCVARAAPGCLPGSGQTLQAIVEESPMCPDIVTACIEEEVVASLCGVGGGPFAAPCSASGAQMGASCGSACGGLCFGLCGPSGRFCDTYCEAMGRDPARSPCSGSACSSPHCEAACASCGAEGQKACSGVGADLCSAPTRVCTRGCGELGSTHDSGVRPDAQPDVARPPRSPPRSPPLPPPPLDPAGPPPLRGVLITAARDLIAFLLPPLLLLWLRSRSRRAAALPGGGAP
jgi:hypothetical protein